MPDAALVEWLRRLGGTPEGVFAMPELLDIVLRILRADMSVCESYRYAPEPPLACPILAFGGIHDPYTTTNGIDAWKGETTGGFSAQMLPGSHFFVQGSERELLVRMTAELQALGT
jgi:medium-chain acyl-[acyl-carrier-protein] hydrolase